MDTNYLSWATSWFGHNAGRIGMIQLRDPDAYVDGYAHALFVDGRISVVGCAPKLRPDEEQRSMYRTLC